MERRIRYTLNSLSKNGASVNSAEAQDALGGPPLSAGLICLEASDQGYDLTADLILLAGACGQVVPGKLAITEPALVHSVQCIWKFHKDL